MINNLKSLASKAFSAVTSLCKKHSRFAPFALLGAIFLVLLVIIIFQNKKISNIESNNSANSKQLVGENVMTKAFSKAGVSICKERIEQVTNFLTANSKSAATIFVAAKNQDQNIATINMEIASKDGDYAFSSATFSPNEDNEKCSATYEAVKFWDNSCEDVAKKLNASKNISKMLKEVKIITINNSVKIFLMPAGEDGCISIKKEVIFN